tara:strand:- start:3 stop:182 length:180 start_codon:yes stop_codon:yes gene_type:complete
LAKRTFLCSSGLTKTLGLPKKALSALTKKKAKFFYFKRFVFFEVETSLTTYGVACLTTI